MNTFNVNRHDILTAALRKWGEGAQADMMLEEMAELAKAILKLRRPGNPEEVVVRIEDVREEVADVQIMLDQMKIVFGDVAEIENRKLSRLMDRILEVEP